MTEGRAPQNDGQGLGMTVGFCGGGHLNLCSALVEMAGFHSSRERAPGAGVRNSVSLPCPLSERPKTDAAIYSVQKLFGTFLHKKVREKKETASCSQKFRGEQIFNSVQNDFVLDSSSVLRPPQNDRGERAPQNDGQGLEMTAGFCSDCRVAALLAMTDNTLRGARLAPMARPPQPGPRVTAAYFLLNAANRRSE